MKKRISKYSNGVQVSDAQYITEIICENFAKKNKKDLHYRFWLEKSWSKFYKSQIASANKLLEKYKADDVISALLSDAGRKIFSLRAPHLGDIIDRAAKENSAKNKEILNKVERNTLSKGKEAKTQKSMIDKLKEIE
jgi:precorrin-3B methylase